MQVDEKLKYYLINYNSDIYIDELCDIINKFGLENYKKICDKFNHTLEKLRRNNLLPTPQEIIDSINNNIPIDLYNIIRNYNIQEYETIRKNYQYEEKTNVQNTEIYESHKGRKH